MLLDVTYADPHAGVHMRTGIADRNGSAASTSEALKRNHYARPGQVSFDERSYKLATIARWKSLGASVKKAATSSIRWRQVSLEERKHRP